MSDHLTDLEQLLLLAVLRVGGGSYAAALKDEIESTADRDISLGTIYVTMMRLEENGLITSGMGEPTSERGGKAKRLYGVTPEGRGALERARTALDRMWRGVDGDEAVPEWA